MTELICSSADVMGMPCFAGTRVPVAFVLAALDAGESFERLQASHPFLTRAHVVAARDFAASTNSGVLARRRNPALAGAWSGGRSCAAEADDDHVGGASASLAICQGGVGVDAKFPAVAWPS